MRGPARLFKTFIAPARTSGKAMARDEKGAVLIEFAILAFPFFTLIYAIIETAMVFFAGQVLDSAVQDAARKVRTGEANALNLTQFRTEICNGLFRIFDCSKLKIEVKPMTSFTLASTSFTVPIKPNCNPIIDPQQCWQVTEQFSPGAGNTIELVQVFYKWPTIINFGGFNLKNQADGSRLLSAVRVFRNEPFT